jgi:type I restriction enzyme S subunit
MGTSKNISSNRYSSYKDSGVEWLGEIPSSWSLTRLGTRFEERKTKVSDKDFPPLSVTKNGTIPQLDSAAKSNDGDNRKLVKTGDFVINSRSDRKGSSGIAYQDGSVSLIYIVIEPKGINPIYCNYLLKSYNFVEEFYRMGHGIVADLWTTRYDEMKAIMVGIPTIEEQTAIAEFLDRKTALIDQAIDIKQKQIELLKERRQILIQKAVTGGLDPNVKMKDSGVEWIGQIPESWGISKLGYLTSKIGDGLHGTPNYTDGTEFYFINGNNLSTGYIEISEQTKTVSEREYILHKKDLNENTLLLSINGTIGNVAFYKDEKVMLGKSAAYLNFYSISNVEYIKWFLESSIFKNYYELELSGSTINNFSLYSIGKTPIVLPSKNEQIEIVEYLKINTTKIVTAISLKEQEIEKLKEYKATLINSAVTGKFKVYNDAE